MPKSRHETFEGEVRVFASKRPDDPIVFSVRVLILLAVDTPRSTQVSTITVENGPHCIFEVATPNTTLPPRWKLRSAVSDMIEGMMSLYRHIPGRVQVILQ